MLQSALCNESVLMTNEMHNSYNQFLQYDARYTQRQIKCNKSVHIMVLTKALMYT